MNNFGFRDLRLVNAYEVAFREARSAVGAAPLLEAAREYASLAEAVGDCSLVVGTTSAGHRGIEHPLLRLEAAACRIHEHAGAVALLFGSEKFGLSNDDLSHCHWLLRIPTADRNLSMNLGQAVALCLYELSRDAKAPASPPPLRRAPADSGCLEEITSRVLDVMRLSGYINPVVEDSTVRKTRRLVRRLGLTAADSRVWLGVLRQALWKLRQKPE